MESYHDALRKIGLCNNDGSHLPQRGHYNAVVCSWFEGPSDIAKGAVITLDVELVLQRHGDAMQRPHKSSMLFEELVQLPSSFQGIIKKNFCKAVETLATSAYSKCRREYVPVRLCWSARSDRRWAKEMLTRR